LKGKEGKGRAILVSYRAGLERPRSSLYEKMAKCRRERWISLAVVLAASLGPRLLSAGPIVPPEQGLGWAVPSWPRGMGRLPSGWRVCPSRGAAVGMRPCPGLGMFEEGGASPVCGLRMMMAGGEEDRREEESRGGKPQEEVVHRSRSEGGGGGEPSWLPVPSDMAEYRTLADLVNMLEEVLGSDDAKRLKPHPGGNRTFIPKNSRFPCTAVHLIPTNAAKRAEKVSRG
jgi:hypothetical protein